MFRMLLCVLPAMAAFVAGLAPSPADAVPITLFNAQGVATIVYDDTGAPPLARAANLLARDLTALSGRKPLVTSFLGKASGPAIVIGLRTAPLVASLLTANHVDSARLAGRWESYGRVALPMPGDPSRNILVIFGSDVRGTIWGVTDLSREMGVSPWEWWADVTIRKVPAMSIEGALHYSREPSVKYRGIFPNDEEFGLLPWASKTFEPDLATIGPKTYDRIFELMWRLKANIFWPATKRKSGDFNTTTGDVELAKSYGLVRGSSHVEMILRNNTREWNDKVDGPYNYMVNKAHMLDYWAQAARQFRSFDNYYTVGLRAADDYPMLGVNTPEQMAKVLDDVIAEQRKLLAANIGKPADQIPQVFTPYKEVLPAYDTGLINLPGDITLNWTDDNFGHIRRLSDAKERARPGGSGVYYHISYWGGPMADLWVATTLPQLMVEEMDKAYRFDARRIWILNVGDIKPGEYLTQLFLDIAFNTDAFPNIASAHAHLRSFFAENFGQKHAQEIADVMQRYYDLAFDRKPEFMGWTTSFPNVPVRQTPYNMFYFGDENARRVTAYHDLKGEAARLMGEMPMDRKDAFFELVQYPVDAAADLNTRVLDMDKSIAYGLQNRASANQYTQGVQAAQESIDADAHFYNDVLAGGKWRGMMGLEPHNLSIYKPPATPYWKNAGRHVCGLQTEGGNLTEESADPTLPGSPRSSLPAFHRELPRSRYIDVFTEMPDDGGWMAHADAPWIHLSQTSGTFSSGKYEQRIAVAVDWASAPRSGSGTITLRCTNSKQDLPVGVTIAAPNAVPHVSFIEEDRIVSMYAAHADEIGAGWDRMPGLSHVGEALRAQLDSPSINSADAVVRAAPHLIYRFATTTATEKAALRVIALPFFAITSKNQMRARVSVDGGPAKVLSFVDVENSEAWNQHEWSNTAEGTLRDLVLKPGAHTVSVTALDPGFTLDRLELDFAGAPLSYGPAPETRIVQ